MFDCKTMWARPLAGLGVLLCVFLSGTIGPAWAQAIPAQDLPTIEKQQNRIQDRHTDDIQIRKEQRRESIDTPPNGMETPKVEVPAGLEGGACVDITAFDVQGAELIPSDVLNLFTAEYKDKCLTLEQINTLLADISNWYMDRGYITTRAYLPPQDLTKGNLEIVVIEGRTESIEFVPARDPRMRLSTAFPNLSGKRLNIRDLEQGLDQINRLPSNNAKLELEPGSKTGQTKVQIENQPGQRVRFTGTEDNTGSRSTGSRQRTIEMDADDIFGMNDLWSVSHKANPRNFDGQRSKTVSGSVSIPYGYWTFEYSDSYFEYASTIQATTSSYESTGISRTQAFTTERVVHRDQDSKTSLEGVLTLKEARNYIAGTLLDSSSRRLSIAGLTARHSTKLWGGSMSAALGYERGLRAFGAKKDHEHVSGEARAQFQKLTSDLSYAHGFKLLEQDLSASLSASGQWAPGVLFSSERFSIGGLSSVRGFKEETLSGDVGGYIRSELAWLLPLTKLTYVDKFLGSLSPYGAADMGWIQADPIEDGEGGVLAGGTLGLRASGGFLTFDVSWAIPLKRHHSITPQGRELYTSVSVNF
ncbi:MAG: ShlB/FhaC/HecB family hemolysin secretion/activation protein [Magnetovibrio sp.]|nr:ShlB/FhaC/HecB family hemolysin secretion/activation protein [Magnetovibrio sp.]